MRISEMLTAIASWLENPNNEAILLAEYDQDCLNIVANSCVQAAALLKITAEAVDDLEPPQESKITPEAIEDLATLAEAFDNSEDPQLQKQAAVIDELLMTIASPPNALAERKDLLDSRLEDLKKRYENPTKELHKNNKVADSIKDIDDSKMTKQYKILEAPLSTRCCPDHPGVQMSRIGQGEFQCELDKKVYNYENGYTLNNGSKVPGGDVSKQTSVLEIPYYSIFTTREDRMNQ